MPRDINDIIKGLSSARRRKVEKRAAELVAEELSLQELRRNLAITQSRLAKDLGVAQKQISGIENRNDMHISTLRRSVEAMGGRLLLVAEFPGPRRVLLRGVGPIGVRPAFKKRITSANTR